MDPIAPILMFFGVALLATSWVYLLIVSYKDDFSWGLCSTFLPPLGYFYGLFQLGKTWEIQLMSIIGVILVPAMYVLVARLASRKSGAPQ